MCILSIIWWSVQIETWNVSTAANKLNLKILINFIKAVSFFNKRLNLCIRIIKKINEIGFKKQLFSIKYTLKLSLENVNIC